MKNIKIYLLVLIAYTLLMTMSYQLLYSVLLPKNIIYIANGNTIYVTLAFNIFLNVLMSIFLFFDIKRNSKIKWLIIVLALLKPEIAFAVALFLRDELAEKENQ